MATGCFICGLRQEGLAVNLKRVRWLYREEQLRVRRRKRKKVALVDRQPLLRPSRQNEVWSVDFVFDRLADGRSLKCLTVVDCTHEAVAVRPDRAMSGAYVARILDRLKHERGLPKVIWSDSGSEFCGKAMMIWAHENGVALRFIEPGKPNQNAYVESFNGRLSDECLNEHWFTSNLDSPATSATSTCRSAARCARSIAFRSTRISWRAGKRSSSSMKG
jgi:putative transposase